MSGKAYEFEGHYIGSIQEIRTAGVIIFRAWPNPPAPRGPNPQEFTAEHLAKNWLREIHESAWWKRRRYETEGDSYYDERVKSDGALS